MQGGVATVTDFLVGKGGVNRLGPEAQRGPHMHDDKDHQGGLETRPVIHAGSQNRFDLKI